MPLGLPAAARLGRRIAPALAGRVRACGRLCLVEEADPAALCAAARDLAPLVLDVADPAGAAAAASLADRVVLVAGPDAEPALAAVVAESLGAVGPRPVVLLNRCGRASERWDAEPHVAVPESRLAAQLAAGRARAARPAWARRWRRWWTRETGAERRARLRRSVRPGPGAVPRRGRGRSSRGSASWRASARRSAASRASSAGADLAAMSAARSMRADYPRLFEPPRAGRTARPTRATCRCRSTSRGRTGGGRARRAPQRRRASRPARRHLPRRRVRAHAGRGARPRARRRCGWRPARRGRGSRWRARAEAELSPAAPALRARHARRAAAAAATTARWPTGWASRCAPTSREAFDRMAAARAARRASRSRSPAASAPTPSRRGCSRPTRTRSGSRRPGTSLHRYGTELDLGPPGAYAWLKANARRFGFIHRYAWEPWHYGFGANPRDREHPAQYERGSWEPPGGDHGRIQHGLPSFVPPRFHDPIARAALRWNVPMDLLAAQLYAESGFNPFARSPRRGAGHRPVHAGHGARLRAARPVRRRAAIDAQAHLMSDLLRQFGGKPALALAAYNAGAGAVRALRRGAAVRGDPRLRGEDPRHPGRRGGDPGGRRVRGAAGGVTLSPASAPAARGGPSAPASRLHAGLRMASRSSLLPSSVSSVSVVRPSVS